MIFNRNYLHINSYRKEVPEQGLEMFNLTANDGDIHQFPTGCIPFHWHSELEIFVLLGGRVQINIRDSTIYLNAGEGCFINTGVLHSFNVLEGFPCRYRSFVFDAGIVGGVPGSIFDVNYVRPIINNGVPYLVFSDNSENAIYFEQFDLAFRACEEEREGYEFCVREALSNILLFLNKKSFSSFLKIASVREMRLKQILEWIDMNIEKEIRLNDIAVIANICPRECQRIFSKYLHCSPMEYIRRQRMLVAADLITTTNEPVTNVALRCGFSSPSYFSSQFKHMFGKSPIEYRDSFIKTLG